MRYFSENSKTYIDELNNCVKEENWELYAIKVHALKGVLANIGNDNLSKWAANLETASKNRNESDTGKNNLEICRNETGVFCEELFSFQEKLKKVLAEKFINAAQKTEDSKKTGTTEIFYEQIKLLDTACANYSFGDTKKIISVLDEYEWDDDKKTKLDNVKQFLSSFDYEKAHECVTQILDHELIGEKNA